MLITPWKSLSRKRVHSGILLSLVLLAGPASGGKFELLPALPNGAVAKAVQLDAGGNIFLVGSLAPQSPRSSTDLTDAFVAKLSPNGSQVLYFTVLAGSVSDSGSALALGVDNSVAVTGTTSSADFPATLGVIQSTLGSSSQTFVARLDPNGVVRYATYLGGNAQTTAIGIAFDNGGNAFVLGSGQPTGSPLIAGGDPATAGGFVMKLDPTFSKALMSFTGLGGIYIAVDREGYVYLAGGFFARIPLPFTPEAFQTSTAAGVCGGSGLIILPCFYEYVAKVDPTGTKIIYLTGLNGTYGATAAGIAADAAGNAIVAGTTNSPNFPVTPQAFQSLFPPVIPPLPANSGASFQAIPPPTTGFVSKLNATGTGLVWSTFFGGSALAAARQYVAKGDTISRMSMDSNGNIYLAGQADSSDFPGLSGTPEGCRPSIPKACRSWRASQRMEPPHPQPSCCTGCRTVSTAGPPIRPLTALSQS